MHCQFQVPGRLFSRCGLYGCGACVATCKNASAMLFTSAKISQLRIAQGQQKVPSCTKYGCQMDAEGLVTVPIPVLVS